MEIFTLFLIIFGLYCLNFIPQKNYIQTTNSAWLQDKYGLSDQEVFIYNILPDDHKREQYLNEIFRRRYL